MQRRRRGLKIRFYGRLADALGRELELEGGGEASVGAIRETLVELHPGAAEALKLSRACVRNAIADDRQMLSAQDDLEFLPPVSGG